MIFERVETRIATTGPEQRPQGQRNYLTGGQDLSAMLWGAVTGNKPKKSAADYVTGNTVYACIKGRADLLQTLPLKAYRFSKGRARWLGSAQARATAVAQVRQAVRGASPQAAKRMIQEAEMEEVTVGPLLDLLYFVNPHWSQNRLWQMTSMSLDLWGKSFWFFDRMGRRLPQEIWWARGDRVQVVVDPKNYISHYLYQPPTGGEPIRFEPDETVWFNFPDPRDEFGSLAPLESARLHADYERDSMKANQALHENGFNIGGIIYPMQGKTWSENDAAAIERHVNNRFKGVDKAHRWSVFRQELGIERGNITPRDAEFVNGLDMSLRGVARAYSWPVYLLGETDATYQNLKEAKKAAWTLSVLPLASFLAAELTEKLIPLFPGQADLLHFDASEIGELQEDEAERWTRAEGQINTGALLINEWRESQGLEPLPHGGVAWLPATLMPVATTAVPQPVEPELIEGEIEPAERRRALPVGRRAAVGDIPSEIREYEAALRALIASGTAGELSREAFEAQLGAEVVALMVLVFLNGSRLAEDDLDSEARDEIAKATTLATLAVGPLAEDVVNGRFAGDSPNDIEARVTLWSTFAAGLFELAKTFRAHNPFLQWRRNAAKDNCEDCKRLNGQVHRARAWRRAGWIPKLGKLDCGGHRCGCSLREVSGPAVGSF